jgi:predicted nucleic acid-binding protein
MDEPGDGFVLDCSLTMAWCFEDEATPYTDGVQDQLITGRALVPTVWPLEVANATLMGERRKRLDGARGGRFLTMLGGFPIIVDDATSTKAFGETLHLARAHGLTTYDAAHLELAIRPGLSLAALDEKRKTAAIAVGVRLLSIP